MSRNVGNRGEDKLTRIFPDYRRNMLYFLMEYAKSPATLLGGAEMSLIAGIPAVLFEETVNGENP